MITPRRLDRRLPKTFAVLALAGLALSACVPSPTTGPTPSPTVKAAAETTAPVETTAPSETPAPVETPIPVVDEPADTVVLFTITTTMALATGEADFVEVVRSPRTMTKAELEALENGGCVGWPQRLANPMVQEVAISSKLVSGAWPKDDEISASAGRLTLFSGDWRGYQAACASAIVKVPGTISVLHLVGGDDPDASVFPSMGWATQSYGFGLVWDGAEPPDSGDPKVTACAIELAPAAEASDLAVHWPDSPQLFPDYGCLFGGEQ